MRDEVKVGRLRNGFTFYSQKGTTYLSGIGCRVGSIHNPPGKAGLQHLVEHLLARRSSEYSVVQANYAMLKYAGGSHNIRTDKTSTFFGHDLVMKKDRMIKLFNLLSGFLIDRIIDREDIAIEKAAVHQEYFLNGKDNAEAELYHMMHELLFPNHPAGSRVDCNVRDLKNISSADIQKFLKKHYVASNMFGIMFGPSHNEVAQRMHHKFGDLPVGTPVTLPQRYVKPFRPLRWIISDEKVKPGLHQTHVAIGVPIGNSSSKDEHLVEILKEVLELRLFDRLRGENTKFNSGVYGAYCTMETSQVHGVLFTQFATTSKSFARDAEQIIIEEMRDLATNLISIEEFDVVTTKLKDEFFSSYKRVPFYLSEMIIEATCSGDEGLIGLHRYPTTLQSANRQKVRETAKKYFNSNYARAVIKPR